MKGETFEPDKLDVSALARESVRLLEPECVQKKISLKNNLQGSFNAYADLNMMRSVIRNLLTNAIKFTKPNGTITINAYRRRCQDHYFGCRYGGWNSDDEPRTALYAHQYHYGRNSQ